MKFVFLSFALIALLQPSAISQPKTGRIKVKMTDDSVVKGMLLSFNNDSIVVKSTASKATVIVPTQDIIWVKIRRQNAVKSGAVIGAATGAIVGLVIWATDEPQDSDTGFPTIDYGPGLPIVMFAVTGGIIGSAIGSTSKQIQVRGNPGWLEEVQKKLSQMKKK